MHIAVRKYATALEGTCFLNPLHLQPAAISPHLLLHVQLCGACALHPTLACSLHGANCDRANRNKNISGTRQSIKHQETKPEEVTHVSVLLLLLHAVTTIRCTPHLLGMLLVTIAGF